MIDFLSFKLIDVFLYNRRKRLCMFIIVHNIIDTLII